MTASQELATELNRNSFHQRIQLCLFSPIQFGHQHLELGKVCDELLLSLLQGIELASSGSGRVWIPKGVLRDTDNIVEVAQEEGSILNKWENLSLNASCQTIERVTHTYRRCGVAGRVTEQLNPKLRNEPFESFMGSFKDRGIWDSVGFSLRRAFKSCQTVIDMHRGSQLLFQVISAPLGNSIQCVQNQLGQLLDMSESTLKGDIIGEGGASDDDIQLGLNGG